MNKKESKGVCPGCGRCLDCGLPAPKGYDLLSPWKRVPIEPTPVNLPYGGRTPTVRIGGVTRLLGGGTWQ